SADPRTRACPIIVLTAETLTDDERQRLRTEVPALAHKGDFTTSELVAVVRRLTRTAGGGAVADDAPTILVVDDHDLNRELCRTLLERFGYRVIVASDGDQGVRVAREVHPDL